jgi:hypothetical protein
MISRFTSMDTSDPLVKYLMLSDTERASTLKPMARLRRKANEAQAGVQQGVTHTFDAHPAPPVQSR